MAAPNREEQSKRIVSQPVWWLVATVALLLVALVLAAVAPELALLWAAPLLLGVVVLMTGIIFVFPGQIIAMSGDTPGVTEVNSVRTTLIQAVGGVAAVFLGVFAYRQLIDTGTQVEIASRGQTDQVLSSAINDLGSEKRVVRTGGAYVLKSLAHDHPQYRETAYTLLTNAIRDAAPSQDLTDPSTLGSMSPELFAAQRDDQLVGQDSFRRRAPDLHAALLVLQDREPLPGKKVFPLRLNDTDVRGSIVNGGDFRRADLRGARLDWAEARARTNSGADFRCAFLQGTVLFGAHLEKSDFRGANFNVATVTTPRQLEDATSQGRFLEGAVFDDGTTFTELSGERWSTERTADHLTSLGMKHSNDKVTCADYE